ncbi:cAMP-regulated D2 protein-like [Haliotis rubra]|uniref:cAMP-regulated D2 protein-like n=1 Tax=Haliotis rubra TaxID=36100 RepID=UPI001EE4FC8A|nr:cAMP-regulated D2 protein-like [Haliotis rubra]
MASLVHLVLLTSLLGQAASATTTVNIPGLGIIFGNVRPGCYEYLGIKYATASRLAAFGFLGSRNLGLRDQMKALEWIHRNIQSFGGNRREITVFGQSAGAQSTALLMSIPSASQYFDQAILQSCPFTLPFRTAAQADSQEAQLATLIGCDKGNLTCYQEADADDILELQDEVELPDASFFMSFEFWGPVIDDYLVKDHLYNIFARGLHKKMNIIIGTVHDEAMGYSFSLSTTPLSKQQLEELLRMISPKLSLELLGRFYDIDGNDDKRFVLAEMSTDYLFRCVSQAVAKIVSKDAAVYSYVFDQKFHLDIWGEGNICNDYVCHGIELPMVFGTYGLWNYTLTHDKMNLSDDLIQYWNNFARDGSPSSKNSSLHMWSSFKTWQQKFLLLQAGGIHMESDPSSSIKCSLLEQFLGFNPR